MRSRLYVMSGFAHANGLETRHKLKTLPLTVVAVGLALGVAVRHAVLGPGVVVDALLVAACGRGGWDERLLARKVLNVTL